MYEDDGADHEAKRMFGAGDELTVRVMFPLNPGLMHHFANLQVRLNLTADTVTFLKNGAAVGVPRRVVHQPYCFAFDVWATLWRF